jgi:hypothetical protein
VARPASDNVVAERRERPPVIPAVDGGRLGHAEVNDVVAEVAGRRDRGMAVIRARPTWSAGRGTRWNDKY